MRRGPVPSSNDVGIEDLPVVTGVSLCSQISDEITDPHTQSVGESHQRMNANRLLSTLDFPDVNRVQVGFLSQLLLGKPRPVAVLPDGFPDKLPLS